MGSRRGKREDIMPGVSKHPLLAPVLSKSRSFQGNEPKEETEEVTDSQTEKPKPTFGWEHKCNPEVILDYGA
jgi:hypothetical protein